MPRVLIVTTNFPRWEGDPHSPWLVQLLSLLRQQGLEFEILAPAYAGQGNHQVHGLSVHRFRYAPAHWETLTHDEGAPNKIRRNPLYLLLLPLYLLAGAVAAGRIGRQGDFDIIHVHWPIPQGLLGLVARWAGGGRLVATFYGADLVLSQRYPFLRTFLRTFVGQCDDVAAISTYTAHQLAAASGRSPRLIPYGISLPPEDEACPVEPGLVLTVGRLIARKGQRYLVEAMALLADRPQVHLVIVGEGHERPNLEATIRHLHLEDRVTLTGRVSDHDLEKLYQRCQVFVLPAIVDSAGDTEMLGMVSLEAMRYRKPVIASEVGGIPDIVKDGQTGLLVAQRSPEALAHAIAQVLDDSVLANRIGQNGYRFAQEHFSWQAVQQQTLALYGLENSRSV